MLATNVTPSLLAYGFDFQYTPLMLLLLVLCRSFFSLISYDSFDFLRVDGFINALLTVVSTNRALLANSTNFLRYLLFFFSFFDRFYSLSSCDGSIFFIFVHISIGNDYNFICFFFVCSPKTPLSCALHLTFPYKQFIVISVPVQFIFQFDRFYCLYQLIDWIQRTGKQTELRARAKKKKCTQHANSKFVYAFANMGTSHFFLELLSWNEMK